MSREIKFRVWHKHEKYMFNPDYLEFIGNDLIIGEDDGDSRYENFPIMQYTGLKDKNGKEIYDGDILKINLYDYEWKTKVRNYCGTLVVDVEGCDWNTTALSFLDDEVETEVIGNIYENPELL